MLERVEETGSVESQGSVGILCEENIMMFSTGQQYERGEGGEVGGQGCRGEGEGGERGRGERMNAFSSV